MSVTHKAIGFLVALFLIILIAGMMLKMIIPAIFLVVILGLGVYLAKDTIRLILKGLE